MDGVLLVERDKVRALLAAAFPHNRLPTCALWPPPSSAFPSGSRIAIALPFTLVFYLTVLRFAANDEMCLSSGCGGVHRQGMRAHSRVGRTRRRAGNRGKTDVQQTCGKAAVCLAFLVAGGVSLAGDADQRETGQSSHIVRLRRAESTLDRVFILGGAGLEAELERAVFDPAPLARHALQLLKRGPKDVRPRAAALLARLARTARNRPLQGLDAAGRVLVGADRARQWTEAQARQREAVRKAWKEEARRARRERLDEPPPPAASLLAPFPPVTEWRLDSVARIRCAIETGLCLLALGERRQALQVFKTIGEKHTEDVAAILAEEGGGDAFMMPGGYAKAVGLYTHALGVCRRVRQYLDSDPHGEVRRLEKRIACKLAEARRRADIEAYGPGFCAYRRAQHLRCREESYLEALLAYEDLARDFPDTLLEAAGEAYCIKCLLALSRPAPAARARTVVKETRRKVEAAEAAIRQAMKDDSIRHDRAVGAKLRRMLDAARARLRRLAQVPLARKAERAAERAAAELLRQEFLPYRGEVLVDLAAHAFAHTLEPRKAETRYRRAWKWLSEVETVDAALDAYDVPAKAREVSKPPQQELSVDRMGNIDSRSVPVDAFWFRGTCPWYLDELRERCALAIGFLHFWKKENDRARAWYAKVPALDEATRMLERKGQWSNHSRLTKGADLGYLNAFPAELALYSGRQRFVVLMADFYYCTERFDRARSLAGRLLAGEFGALDAKQDDYPQFLIGTCRHWERDRKGAYEACKAVLDEEEWTLTQDRAAFTAANLSWYVRDEKILLEGMDLLERMAASRRDNPYVHRARLVLGVRLLELGQVEEGAKWLRRVPGKQSGYRKVARRYLEALAEFEQTAKSKRKGG